jgi:hypothetical protein
MASRRILNMRKIIIFSVMSALVAGNAAAIGKPVDTAPPAAVQALLGCRTIADSAQRLACYDRESTAVAQAISKRDLVVVDQERAREAKRSLFGFSVPNFSTLLGGGGDLNQIQGSVTGVSQNADGGWTVKLDDGSVWTQTDDTPVALPPGRGDKAIVSRGTLGSYFLKLGGQPGFKVKRIG